MDYKRQKTVNGFESRRHFITLSKEAEVAYRRLNPKLKHRNNKWFSNMMSSLFIREIESMSDRVEIKKREYMDLKKEAGNVMQRKADVEAWLKKKKVKLNEIY